MAWLLCGKPLSPAERKVWQQAVAILIGLKVRNGFGEKDLAGAVERALHRGTRCEDCSIKVASGARGSRGPGAAVLAVRLRRVRAHRRLRSRGAGGVRAQSCPAGLVRARQEGVAALSCAAAMCVVAGAASCARSVRGSRIISAGGSHGACGAQLSHASQQLADSNNANLASATS